MYDTAAPIKILPLIDNTIIMEKHDNKITFEELQFQ